MTNFPKDWLNFCLPINLLDNYVTCTNSSTEISFHVKSFVLAQRIGAGQKCSAIDFLDDS